MKIILILGIVLRHKLAIFFLAYYLTILDLDSYFIKKFFNGPIIMTDRASEKGNFFYSKMLT